MKKHRKVKKLLCTVGIALVLLLAAGWGFLFLNGLSGVHLGGEGKEGQIKVACVGDSVTYGHGVSFWPLRNYPQVLGNLLGDGYYVRNFGVSGTTAMETGDRPYVNHKVYKESLDYEADIVVLMMGSNDSKPENWQDAEEFKAQYIKLVDSYLAGAEPPQVYLCTLAKAHDNSFDIQDEWVAEISRIITEVAREKDLPLIDIRTLTKAHPEWFTKDGVHPNADGAASMAELVASTIR